MNSPKEIAVNYIQIAQEKTSLKWYKMLILAILAGVFISFGAATATAVSAGLSGGIALLVKGMVFPVGLILVVVCGAELFTGNCLLISPLIGKDIKLLPTLKSWGIVYLGNLIGSIIIAVIVVYSHVQNDTIASSCVAIAEVKSNLTFGDALLRGILCNIIVCLAVWASMASKNIAGKVVAVYFPVLAFVVCGFEHSVANMYYLTAGLLASAEYGIAATGLTVGRALLYCLLPVTIGNVIGGGLIAIAYHAAYRLQPKVKSE